jgi:hypothetical protein
MMTFVAAAKDTTEQDTAERETAEPATSYTDFVWAQNRGRPSTWSNEVAIRTPSDEAPKAPTNLRAAPLSEDRIRLTWQDNNGSGEGTDLEYTYFISIFIPSSSVWIEIPFPLPASTHSANLVGLSPSREYTIRILARNTFGDSEPSNTVSARTFSPEATCTTTTEVLCLLQGRFQVEVSFRNQHAPGSLTRSARALPSTDQIGEFWFFDQDNIELVVKLIDGRSINGHFWAYYGGITDLEVWLTITDTQTNTQRIYHQEPGKFCGEADTMAFPASENEHNLGTQPLARTQTFVSVGPSTDLLNDLLQESTPRSDGSETCRVDRTTLCLLNRRLEVTLNWRLPGLGQSLMGQAINDGGDTGTFWFFDPENTEIVIKAIDGHELNNHLWIFFGALSNLEYEIVVTDTLTGEQRSYYNAPGDFCGQADTQAFQVSPPP